MHDTQDVTFIETEVKKLRWGPRAALKSEHTGNLFPESTESRNVFQRHGVSKEEEKQEDSRV